MDPTTFLPLLRAEISTVDQLYIHQETLQCISAGCIVCSYKLLVKLPSGAKKVCMPNQRPEQCLRCVHRTKTPLDTSMAGLYPSSGNILILGDGDLSFSLALCHRLAACRRRMNHPPSKSTESPMPPVNVVATTYLTKDQLRKTYPSTAGSNMVNLIKYGVVPVHGVDATTLGTSKCKLVLHAGNDERKYHRVIWNFPCVHSPMDSVNQIQRGRDGQSTEIEDNKRLMVEFFNHVVDLLVPGGEVHIVHKTKEPYNWWNIEEQVGDSGMSLAGAVVFDRAMYPGYVNKKAIVGKGSFPISDARTYVFVAPMVLRPSIHIPSIYGTFDTMDEQDTPEVVLVRDKFLLDVVNMLARKKIQKGTGGSSKKKRHGGSNGQKKRRRRREH